MIVWSTCAPGFAFSLISWLSVSQSGHTIYQIKAKYLSYCMVLIILLLVKTFKIYVLNSGTFSIFVHHFF